MKLPQPVAIAGFARTPIGKIGGALASDCPSRLLAACFQATLSRFLTETAGVWSSVMEDEDEEIAKMTPSQIETIEPAVLALPDEIIVGCVRNGIGNIARIAALRADISEEVPAMTIDRQCASSMEAVAIAAAKINAGLGHNILVGGAESASRAPWLFHKTTSGYSYSEPQPFTVHMAPPEKGDPSMGETAEILADEFKVTREEMDAYALESHKRAAKAWESGAFWEECVDYSVKNKRGEATLVNRDECVRADATLEALTRLKPAFRKDGRVTAGNACPVNDGAASCCVISKELVERTGIEPEAWITGVSTVGLSPSRMGMGPALAIPKLLDEQKLKMKDIDLFEINEAFAAQILAVNRELKIPADKLNILGGAIALGHPLGATGLRIIGTLITALKTRKARRGVASLCVGGGQGMAVLVELPAD